MQQLAKPCVKRPVTAMYPTQRVLLQLSVPCPMLRAYAATCPMQRVCNCDLCKGAYNCDLPYAEGLRHFQFDALYGGLVATAVQAVCQKGLTALYPMQRVLRSLPVPCQFHALCRGLTRVYQTLYEKRGCNCDLPCAEGLATLPVRCPM